MALPPEARAALADHLRDSLDPEVDSDAEEAWRQEIRLRLVDLDSEIVAAIPWSEARSRLRPSFANDDQGYWRGRSR